MASNAENGSIGWRHHHSPSPMSLINCLDRIQQDSMETRSPLKCFHSDASQSYHMQCSQYALAGILQCYFKLCFKFIPLLLLPGKKLLLDMMIFWASSYEQLVHWVQSAVTYWFHLTHCNLVMSYGDTDLGCQTPILEEAPKVSIHKQVSKLHW